MDDIDKKLVSILQKNGRTSLSEIGKQLGMSHVAVSKRLDKLVGLDHVQVTAGVNAEYLDAKIFFIGLETENMEVAERIQEDYRNCPRVLHHPASQEEDGCKRKSYDEVFQSNNRSCYS